MLLLLTHSMTLVTKLAVATSLIGVVLGFLNKFYNTMETIPSQSYSPVEDIKLKVALMMLLLPILVLVTLGSADGTVMNNLEIINTLGPSEQALCSLTYQLS